MKKFITLFLVLMGLVSSTNAANVLKGSWDGYAGSNFVSDNGSPAQESVTISITDVSHDYWFYVLDGDGSTKWFVENGAMTNSSCTDWTLFKKSDNYMKFTPTIAGEYRFSIIWYQHDDSQYYVHLSIIYPKAEQYTVHFQNTSDWSSVYVHRYLSGKDYRHSTWPGTQLSASTINSTFYDVSFSDSYNAIIFNNNSGSQSSDFVVDFNSTEYWVTYDAETYSINDTPPASFTYTRTGLSSGKFGTICLPYAVSAAAVTTAASTVKFYKIASKVMSGSTLTGVNLLQVDDLEAGKAYIYEAQGDGGSFTVALSGNYTTATAGEGMMGNIGDATLVPQDNYVIQGNKLRKVASDDIYVGQYKAYITLEGIGGPSPAPGLDFIFMSLVDNNTTGITAVNHEQTTNNRCFNLAGQRVANPNNGLYIVNGRKVVIK